MVNRAFPVNNGKGHLPQGRMVQPALPFGVAHESVLSHRLRERAVLPFRASRPFWGCGGNQNAGSDVVRRSSTVNLWLTGRTRNWPTSSASMYGLMSATPSCTGPMWLGPATKSTWPSIPPASPLAGSVPTAPGVHVPRHRPVGAGNRPGAGIPLLIGMGERTGFSSGWRPVMRRPIFFAVFPIFTLDRRGVRRFPIPYGTEQSAPFSDCGLVVPGKSSRITSLSAGKPTPVVAPNRASQTTRRKLML
jgi:hypothetical protein